MNDPRRLLIEAVARGEISPQEAAEQLAEATGPLPPAVAPAPLPPPQPDPSLTTVRVIADFGEIRVYGDASVNGAVADGPHTARQEGSQLVIAADLTGMGGFVFGRRGRVRLGLGAGRHDDRIVVRMNPRLALELECRAGALRVEGVEGPIRCDVSAGDVRIDGFRSPIDISVQAGQLRAAGLLDRGESRIRCQAGQVRLDLERGSSVRIRAGARFGSVDLDDGHQSVGIGGGTHERVVGAGTGLLEIDAALGHVEVRSGS